MTFSVYHLFSQIVEEKECLEKVRDLAKFPFDKKMLSCQNKGQFPDLAIRISKNDPLFSGGELIELKDSRSYVVSSFNSTIPTGKKDIAPLISSKSSKIRAQMEKAGDDILSLPVRDVFYLVRGKSNKQIKVCLVNGKFFETVPVPQLISNSFILALEERLKETGQELTSDFRIKIQELFDQQETFSKTRTVHNASVRLRFRIMTEVLAEGNILNSVKYPQIKDNTLNFLIPCHSKEEEDVHRKRMEKAFAKEVVKHF